MKKVKFPDLIILINTFFLIFLTFKYEWWSNGNLKFPDFLFLPLLILSLVLSTKSFISFLILTLLAIFSNIHYFNPIVSCALLFFSAYMLGHFFITKFLKINLSLYSLQSLAVGFALISTTIFFFSFFKINFSIVYLLIFILPSIIIFSKTNQFSFKNLYDRFEEIKSYPKVILFYLLGYYFFSVILNEVSHDAVSHHLTIPVQMNLNHYWEYDVNKYIWSVVPQGTQWIFTFLYFFGGIKAIKLFLFIIILLLFIYFYIFCNKLIKNKELSIAASLIFLSLPINLYLLRGQFIDIFHSFIVTAIFLIILNKEEKNWRIISLLLGFSFAIKSSTIIILPVITIVYIIEKISLKNLNIKDFFFCLFLFLFFSTGPYLVAFLKTGSPTFPLYNEIFKSLLISSSAFYHPLYANENLYDFFNTSLNSKKYGEFSNNGAIGIFFLTLTPLLFFHKIKNYFKLEIIIFFGLIAATVIMFKFQAYLRYIYFVVPSIIFCLIIISESVFGNKKILIFIIYLLVAVNCLRFDKINSELIDNPKLYFNNIIFEEYDSKLLPLKNIAKIINSEKKFKDKRILILSFYDDPAYFLFKNNVSFFSWHSLDFFNEIVRIGDLKKTMDLLNIDFVIYDTNYNTKNYEKFFKGHPKNFTKKIIELHGYIIAEKK